MFVLTLIHSAVERREMPLNDELMLVVLVMLLIVVCVVVLSGCLVCRMYPR